MSVNRRVREEEVRREGDVHLVGMVNGGISEGLFQETIGV